MAGSKATHTAFGTMHPAVPALYAGLTLGLTMFSMHPVLIALSLAGAFAYLACARGAASALSALRWQVPVVAVVALVNPLFVHMGSTVLFEFFGRPVFLESLLYGLAMAGLFLASVEWFAAFSHMLTYDKVMGLFGGAAPTVALMVSMTMRLVPRFLRQGRTIASVQDVALSCADGGRPGPGRVRPGGSSGHPDVPAPRVPVVPSHVRARLRQTSVLMGWAMEDSLETADAMRARGWGARRKRTTYAPYRFTGLDAAVTGALLAGGALCVWVSWFVTSSFAFYPRLSPMDLWWWGYLPYGAWMLVPAVLHVYESRRFA